MDVSLRLRGDAGTAQALQVNEAMLDQLALAARQVQARFPQIGVDLVGLLGMDGVLVKPAFDAQALQQAALEVLDAALDDMVATRGREGERLGGFLRERLDGIERCVAQVRQWLPEIRAGLRARLEQRLADLKQPADPGRLEQELVLALSRIDVDEELDRLTSHIVEARRILQLADANGRRLDFPHAGIQPRGQYAGLGSRSISAPPRSRWSSKVLIEQMREQVQNIE